MPANQGGIFVQWDRWLFFRRYCQLVYGNKSIDEREREEGLESNEKWGGLYSYATCLTPVTSFQVWNRFCKVWWYHLSRQKWTNFEMELSSMRELTLNNQIDTLQKVSCSLTTDDIVYSYKNESTLLIHSSLLKPSDSL